MSLSRSILVLFAGVMVQIANLACGQSFPTKTIRIVTSELGGGNDLHARLIAPRISPNLGQPVIVDNRVAIRATEVALNASPDGYTLLVGGAGIWILPLLQKQPSYDVEKDFSPISLLSKVVNVLVVHPSVPAKSVRELIDLAKAKPGQLNYAGGAIGSGNHLAMEAFKSLAGVNIVNISYQGVGPSLNAVIAGETQMMIASSTVTEPFIKAGRLRALAVTSATPSVLLPNLPTVAASGVPGYESVSMTGIWAPAKTPAAIIRRFNQEVVQVIRLPEVKETLLKTGTETVGSSPEEFAATIKIETDRTRKVVKDANIKLN